MLPPVLMRPHPVAKARCFLAPETVASVDLAQHAKITA